MKKLLALILAAMLVFACTAALAEDFEVSQDYSSIPVTKNGDYDASGDPAAELIFTSVSVTGSKAVIEMAAASGLPLLSEKERDPLSATTYGTGE